MGQGSRLLQSSLSVSETSPTIPMAELANFKKTVPVLTEARKKKIFQLANLNHLAPNLKDEYLKLIMLFHDVISTSEFDILIPNTRCLQFVKRIDTYNCNRMKNMICLILAQ